jgi:hypothetical protein
MFLNLNTGANWANIRAGTIIFALARIDYISAVDF